MRKINSFMNFITSTIPFFVLIILGFWKINVWQRSLDEDIYAINQLFFQLFAYLSLAEAGIGALVQKEYYKLLANNDRDTICIYYTLSKKMLKKVCVFILLAGYAISFFLPYLANDNNLTFLYMQKIFLLFLIKSLVEYFLFSPRFVLQADQKIYKINLQMNGYKILEVLLETILIGYGWSFDVVLVVTLGLRILMNLHLNAIIFKEYDWLKEVKDTQELKIRGMSHVLVYKIVSVVYENIDIVLISAFVNPISVIIYSNYKYITKYINDLLYIVGNSITSSFGNLLYTEDYQKGYDIYEMINTMFYFIATVLTIALGYCMNAFIVIWVGGDKLFDRVSFACILFIFFHNVVRKPQYIVKDIFALYKELQIIFIAEAMINGIVSVILVQFYGIKGVLLATVFAIIMTNFWYFPMYIYKNVFHRKPWIDFGKYIFSILGVVFFLGVSEKWFPTIPSTNYILWFFYSVLYGGLVILVFGMIFFGGFKSFRGLLYQSLELLKSFKKNKEKTHE